MTTPDSLVTRANAYGQGDVHGPGNAPGLGKTAREAVIAIAATFVLLGFSFAEAGPHRVESRFGDQAGPASSMAVESGGDGGALWEHVRRLAGAVPEVAVPPITETAVVPASPVPGPVSASPASARPARTRRTLRAESPEPIEAAAAAERAAAPDSQGEAPGPLGPVEPEGPGDYLGAFSVTCYALDGDTASGEPVHEGGVAVDRRVIPLGTRLYIESVGWRVANDTGGSVRGNRLDIWLPSRDHCILFGRQILDVYRS